LRALWMGDIFPPNAPDPSTLTVCALASFKSEGRVPPGALPAAMGGAPRVEVVFPRTLTLRELYGDGTPALPQGVVARALLERRRGGGWLHREDRDLESEGWTHCSARPWPWLVRWRLVKGTTRSSVSV